MNKLGGPWRQAALEVARTATKKFGKEVHQVRTRQCSFATFAGDLADARHGTGSALFASPSICSTKRRRRQSKGSSSAHRRHTSSTRRCHRRLAKPAPTLRQRRLRSKPRTRRRPRGRRSAGRTIRIF